MADTVDTAASRSSADEAAKPVDAAPADGAGEPTEAARGDGAASADGAGEPTGDAPTDGAAEPDEDSAADEAEEQSEDAAPPDEDEEPEEDRTLTQLMEQLAGELGELGTTEAQLEAARNLPEVRRSARDIAGILILAVAGLAAFAFLNVAAMDGLSKEMDSWLAALVLAAVWVVVVAVLLFSLMGRARRWLLWIVIKEPPRKALEELERERNAAGRAARTTLEQLGPALAVQIALAAMPKAGEVAGDVASGVVEVGDSVLDASDEIIGQITEEIPGGGVVNQVWAVALTPGRFGIRIATTVLRRGRSRTDDGAS